MDLGRASAHVRHPLHYTQPDRERPDGLLEFGLWRNGADTELGQCDADELHRLLSEHCSRAGEHYE